MLYNSPFILSFDVILPEMLVASQSQLQHRKKESEEPFRLYFLSFVLFFLSFHLFLRFVRLLFLPPSLFFISFCLFCFSLHFLPFLSRFIFLSSFRCLIFSHPSCLPNFSFPSSPPSFFACFILRSYLLSLYFSLPAFLAFILP
jgi:hypothetical protein